MITATDTRLRQSPPDEILFEQIALGLETRGFVILPAALPDGLATGLLDYLDTLDPGAFHRARIGRGRDLSRNRFVRRDRIYWIEHEHPGGVDWLQWLRSLKDYLNRRLFLGLFSCESHFSIYRQGDFYRRHRDAFRGESNRVLSLVTYLNRGWLPDQGGELLIFSTDDESELVRVTPSYGTLVLFLSEEFPHEVLPTSRDRFGVAAWFRVNGSVNDSLDPPR